MLKIFSTVFLCLILFAGIAKTNIGSTKQAKLIVKIEGVECDTITLQFTPTKIFTGTQLISFPDRKAIQQKTVNGKAIFMMDGISSPNYIDLIIPIKGIGLAPIRTKTITILEDYFIENGDEVTASITLKPKDKLANFQLQQLEAKMLENRMFEIEFSGKGSKKMECWKKMDDSRGTPVYEKYGNERYERSMQDVLKNYRNVLSEKAYQILLLKSICNSPFSEKYRDLVKIFLKDVTKKDSLMLLYNKYHLRDEQKLSSIDNSIKLNNIEYLEFFLVKNYALTSLHTKDKNDNRVLPLFNELNNNLKNNSLRERMLALFFFEYTKHILPFIDSLIDESFAKSKLNEPYKSIIAGYSNFSANKKAYNFELLDKDGKLVSLKDFKGKVVFVDFWFTGCTFCKLYYENDLKHVEEKFKENPNIVFITISWDDSFDTWKESLKSGGYTSEHVINLCTDGMDHPLVNHYRLKTAPTPMVIDQNGIIADVSRGLRKKDYLIKAIETLLNKKESVAK